MRDTLADSLSGVEGAIRRSLAATDAIDTQSFIKSDPLGLRGGQLV
jgi:hypothetical protein